MLLRYSNETLKLCLFNIQPLCWESQMRAQPYLACEFALWNVSWKEKEKKNLTPVEWTLGMGEENVMMSAINLCQRRWKYGE